MANVLAPSRVFYSYSHADVRMLESLRKHMAMLRRRGLITEWYDREIEAGSEWRPEIELELERADVILLLVSANFLASDFCYEQEMARAVERARRGEALVIGVMLRPVEGWADTPFAEFQVVPRHGRPISKWSDTDEAYTDVVERIRAALENRGRSVAAGTAGGELAPELDVTGESTGRASRLARRPTSSELPADVDIAMRTAQTASTTRTEGVALGVDRLSGPARSDEEVLSETELKLLATVRDPEQRRIQRDAMVAQKEHVLHKVLGNLDKMRSDMAEAVRRSQAEATDPATPGS